MAVDPYQVLKESYDKRTAAINQATQQQEAEKQKREQQAQETLTNANRGVYTSFQKQINPYGSFANQNNFSQGVTDYYKNASYGTMLQGLGTNQYNYNDAITNSNTLWNNYLAEKAGQEAEALNDYNSAVLAQQQEDERIQREKEEEEERIRQFNLQLQLQQEQLERQKAQDEEDKRRYDQEWAYQMSQSGGSGSGGSSGSSSGSSSRKSSNQTTDLVVPNNNFTPTGDQRKDASQNSTKNTSDNYKNRVIKTEYQPSNVPGYQYRVFYYADGSTSKVMVKK